MFSSCFENEAKIEPTLGFLKRGLEILKIEAISAISGIFLDRLFNSSR